MFSLFLTIYHPEIGLSGARVQRLEEHRTFVGQRGRIPGRCVTEEPRSPSHSILLTSNALSVPGIATHLTASGGSSPSPSILALSSMINLLAFAFAAVLCSQSLSFVILRHDYILTPSNSSSSPTSLNNSSESIFMLHSVQRLDSMDVDLSFICWWLNMGRLTELYVYINICIEVDTIACQ
ncbi:hypothetical protein PMIN03_010414 [Paraphaeosphaeria minitans]